MESFAGKLAVVSGGGSGIGRQIVIQLAGQGCSVAACDLNQEAVRETAEMATAGAPLGAKVTGHACDVSSEPQVQRFRDAVLEQHATRHVDLVFNNAGTIGGNSFVAGSREAWERTFAVDWWGVYYCARAFLPLLIESSEGLLVNVCSVHGFFARAVDGYSESAYSTAKFAVKGFSESLIADLRQHAPHVKVALVMPGYIGTEILSNTFRTYGLLESENPDSCDLGNDIAELFGPGRSALLESRIAGGQGLLEVADEFRKNAPTSAADAAALILGALKAGRWRILVGDDAIWLDTWVRTNPEGCYSPELPVKPNSDKLLSRVNARLWGMRRSVARRARHVLSARK